MSPLPPPIRDKIKARWQAGDSIRDVIVSVQLAHGVKLLPEVVRAEFVRLDRESRGV